MFVQFRFCTSRSCAQAEKPGDTNKTPRDCPPVPALSQRVHVDCNSSQGAVYFAASYPLDRQGCRFRTPDFTHLAAPSERYARGMADRSPKGLLPQLTDVLCALTESQELLLGKLQSVRLEHPSVVPTVIFESAHERADSVDPPLPLVDSTTISSGLTSEVDRSSAIDPAEPSTGTTSSSSFESQETPASASTSATGATALHDVDDAAGADATPPMGTRAVPGDPTAATSATHHYNFFDELDTRLAHLDDPNGSGSV